MRITVLCAVLAGCAQAHGRIEGPPFYVHLCYSMPPDDQEAWGEAAATVNRERAEDAVWVGHGPPDACSAVDVCPSSAVHEGAEARVGECVITVRYAPGTAREVATQVLKSVVLD